MIIIIIITGRLYNEHGAFVNWWTNASIANFVERQHCFEDQYSQYSLFGYNVSQYTTRQARCI